MRTCAAHDAVAGCAANNMWLEYDGRLDNFHRSLIAKTSYTSSFSHSLNAAKLL